MTEANARHPESQTLPNFKLLGIFALLGAAITIQGCAGDTGGDLAPTEDTGMADSGNADGGLGDADMDGSMGDANVDGGDGGEPCTPIIQFADTDGDGFGDAAAAAMVCAGTTGYTTVPTDCDDSDDEVFPGANEVCDEKDNDCNGQIDESVTGTWYVDADGDTYGDPTMPLTSCVQGSGVVADNTDCDDTADTINPGEDEVCGDMIDNNCDGNTDDPTAVDATAWYYDGDADTFGNPAVTVTQCDQPTNYVADNTDCSDINASINSAASEVCDGADNNCDGETDESTAIDATTWYQDSDGDNYGNPAVSQPACTQPTGYVTDNTDCHDTVATAYPGSHETETPKDNIDTDCDGNDYCTDLNCDGRPDLFIPEYYTGSSYNTTSYIYTNQGGATPFDDTNRTGLTTYGARRTAIADVDNNGYQDIIVPSYRNQSSYNTNSLVFLGSASGYSDAAKWTLPAYGAVKAVVEDINGDNYKDIVLVSHYDGNYQSNTMVYWGSSFGYTSSTSIPTNGAFDAAVADLNEDGNMDLVICEMRSSSSDYSEDSHIYWGTGSGLDTGAPTALPTEGCRQLKVDDIDGDNHLDIVFANYRNSGAANNDKTTYQIDSYVYWGDGTQAYSDMNRTGVATNGTLDVTIGDYNNDGKKDLFFSGYYIGNWSSSATWAAYPVIHYGDDSGTSYAFTSSATLGDTAIKGTRGAAIGDINKDGYPEIVLPRYQNAYARDSYVYWGSASGYSDSGSNRTNLASVGPVFSTMGDLNGDGYPEIIYNNYYSGNWSTLNAPTYIYWGSASGYSALSRTDLSTLGTLTHVKIVGNSTW